MNERNANEHRFSTEKTNMKKIHFYYIYVALIWELLKYSVQMFYFLKNYINFVRCANLSRGLTFNKLSILHFSVFFIWSTNIKKTCGWQNSFTIMTKMRYASWKRKKNSYWLNIKGKGCPSIIPSLFNLFSRHLKFKLMKLS
jgi:hypothetical protein